MKRRLRPRIFAALLLLGGRAALADLELTFDVERTEVAEQPGPPRSTARRSAIDVRIGRDYAWYREASGPDRSPKVILDFRNRRIYTVDESRKTLANDSMFAEVGFRDQESKDRAALRKSLPAGDPRAARLVEPLVGHLLAIGRDDGPSPLARVVEGETTSFRWEGRPLASTSGPFVPAEADERARFVGFLRYDLGGHPHFLKELAGLSGIPSRIEVDRHESRKREEVVLTLKSSTRAKDEPVDLSGFKPPTPPEGEPLERLLLAVRSENPSTIEKHANAILARARDDLGRGRSYEAVFGLVLYGLSTGKPIPAGFEALQGKTSEDDDVRKLATTLKPKSREEATAALASLDQLKARPSAYTHVLKIFEAGIRMRLGELPKAEGLFLEALEHEKEIAGGWKDLGDLYQRRREMRLAWRCWDVGRLIAPGHALFKPINALEEVLVRDHPEYFNPDRGASRGP